MKNILKYVRANVSVTDKATGRVLFEDHNLFVDSGRVLIANFFFDPYPFDKSKMACDLGDNAATPTVADLDLGGYLTGCSIAMTGGAPQILPGEPTGVLFQFSFDNTGLGGDKTIRELGLFYRQNSDNFPLRGTGYPSDVSLVGRMIARLKTAGSSITVANTRTINIDWKIIF